MGKHRQARRVSRTRFTLVRATTAMGVAGALALFLQSTHDSPTPQTRPESLHSPLPDATGPEASGEGGDRIRTGQPAHGVLSPTATPTRLPVVASGPSRPGATAGESTPDGAGPDQLAAPDAPGPTPAAAVQPRPDESADPGSAGAPSGEETPARSGPPAQPSGSPAPSGSATPVGPLGDLLHDLVTTEDGRTAAGDAR
ncbi:hypothetical protein [Streptomyces sp. NPDC047928]|uniref:hypothetical protein n=1 Tax=unclassified Streptomyces TaxID=2593676 RepID=UPI003712854A